jgi:ABC-type phosphate transport system substrate-binding protein
VNLLPAVVAVLALLTLPSARAGEVIAGDAVSLSTDEIRDLFLGEKQLAGNLRLVAVDNRAAQADFLAKILQTDIQKYTARWTKKTFREGLTAPTLRGSDDEVIAFVRSTPGAVGYVSRPTVGIKVLQRF